jgi:hypothetical protein
MTRAFAKFRAGFCLGQASVKAYAGARMWRFLLLFWITLLPLAAVEVMWTGTGTVSGAHSGFGVKAGEKVDLLIRYSLKEKVQSSNLATNSNFVKRVVYHGPIRLRIEIRVGTKQWVSYTESTSFPLSNAAWYPFEVLSVDPIVPPGSAGDLITFRSYLVAGSKFEQFHYPFPHSQRNIRLTIGDLIHPYTLLNLEQFPDKTLQTGLITDFSGSVFTEATDNPFNFIINKASVVVSDYYPPIKMTIRPYGGNFILAFDTEAGGWYELKGSDELKTWYSLGVHRGFTDGIREILVSKSGAARYYRMDRLPGSPF